MKGQRPIRVLLGGFLAVAWVLTDAAPWISDRVMPDYNPRGEDRHRPEVVQAYADETAREAILAGTLSLVVFALCLWLVFGKPWKERA